MTTPVALFAEAARAYCRWCENPGHDEKRAADAASRHVVKLYVHAIDLRRPDTADLDLDGQGPSEDELDALRKRLGVLPFQYCGSVFDPQEVPAGEPTVGDVVDDLVDIHRDLAEGLWLYDRGYVPEANGAGASSSSITGGRTHPMP